MRWLPLVFVLASAPAIAAPLVTYDADHLDLDKHELQFKAAKQTVSAALIVYGEDGKQIGKGEATYPGWARDSWMTITWTPDSTARVATMSLRVVYADKSASMVKLIPWSVSVEHEDVNFPTDKFTIEDTEAPKLDASCTKIQEIVKQSAPFMKITLYVAGHTDTVGPGPKNATLSLNRARAIAAYFRKKGIKIPIAFAGFGESVLKLKTADNVDERANRRADYVLGPTGGSPPFKGPYLRVKAAWKTLP